MAYYIPSKKLINALIKYANGCNERMKGPVVRFLADYHTIDQISGLTGWSEQRVKEFAFVWCNYFTVNWDGTTLSVLSILNGGKVDWQATNTQICSRCGTKPFGGLTNGICNNCL